MKTSPTVYALPAIAGLLLLVAVPFVTYIGGYFLLVDRNGLYPSKRLYEMYMPAVRFQASFTGTGVKSGYVDSTGRGFVTRYGKPPPGTLSAPPGARPTLAPVGRPAFAAPEDTLAR